MDLFTCNECSTTGKVAVMTRFLCSGNDVAEMTARLKAYQWSRAIDKNID